MTEDERPIELTEGEREALAALPRERSPGHDVERRTLERLRDEGLVTGGSERWRRHLLLLAASLLLLAIGFAGGSLLSRPAAPAQETRVVEQAEAPPGESPGDRYLLLLYQSPDEVSDPDGEAARVEEYSAWARQLAERGHLLGGEPLAADGRLLVPGDGGVDALEQSSLLGEEPMTGYFLISARSAEEAEAVARECPHLAHGGKVMLRRIGHEGP